VNEQSALLQAICASPQDDLPRLVYADWLDDHGEPDRAEFIRTQVELARRDVMEKCEYPSTRCNVNSLQQWTHASNCPLGILRRREKELLDKWGAFAYSPGGFDWCENCTDLSHVRGTVGVFFSRGFVSRVTCDAETWLRYADSLYWSPEQVRKCYGSYLTECPHNKGVCPYCHGTGTVPRPFPPTAQPITDVTIVPPFHVHEWIGRTGNAEIARWVNANDHMKGFSDDRWPDITFTLFPK